MALGLNILAAVCAPALEVPRRAPAHTCPAAKTSSSCGAETSTLIAPTGQKRPGLELISLVGSIRVEGPDHGPVQMRGRQLDLVGPALRRLLDRLDLLLATD